MIVVKVSLDKDRLISRISASGHAGAGIRGNDVVCAAATSLLRTVARTLERDKWVELESEAPNRGYLTVDVRRVPEDRRQWFLGVQDTLLNGIRDLVNEHPDRCSLTIVQPVTKEES